MGSLRLFSVAAAAMVTCGVSASGTAVAGSEPAAACAADLPTDSVPLGSQPLSGTIVLRRDGIGVASFCGDADATVGILTELLGEPDNDTDWAEPITISACGGTAARRVTWGSLDLFFGDASQYQTGPRHFFGYLYGDVDGFDTTPPGLSTPEGIGVGTPVELVQAAYPDASMLPGEEGIQDPTFYVDANLQGRLTDLGPEGVVTQIIGGEACAV